MEAPTLLIGLGGIGSRIVNEVYGRIPVAHKNRVAVQIFDTDVNDLSRLRNLNERHIVQTSTAETVGNYLKRVDNSVYDWFPHENRLVNQKVLSEGAGQVRAISRLGYRAAMQYGKLTRLQTELSEIYTVSGDNVSRPLRVMVISTLAGGTGSGIFIQTALYLRWLFARYGYTPLIRGIFILPEVLVDTNVLPDNQRENAEANAYACIKEVNQILQIAKGDGSEVDLEFRPDQVDSAGRLDHSIPGNVQLYDSIQLIGYKNNAIPGQNLRNFNDYIAQAIDSVYITLFTSVGDRILSTEDNFLINQVRAAGLARYGSIGVATLEYPYEEILKYCALRWATDTISGAWLKIDELFNRERDKYLKDVKSGLALGEPPDLKRRYVELLALEGDPVKGKNRFLKRCYLMTQLRDADGNPTESKASAFIRSLEEEMNQLLLSEKKMENLGEVSPNLEQLSSKDEARVHVHEVEKALRDLEQEIKTRIPFLARFLLHRCLYADRESPNGMEGGNERLNTWILAKNDPVHPVAARAMLYDIYNILSDEVATIQYTNNNEHAGLRTAIENYKKAYDDPETKNIEETAFHIVEDAVKQRFFKTKIKNFAHDYFDKANEQKDTLAKYKISFFKEILYTEFLQALSTLIKEYEDYFQSLQTTNMVLLRERNVLSEMHEGNNDPTRLYVLATKDKKEKLWEDFCINKTSDDFDEDLSKELYLGLYRRFCAEELDEKYIRSLDEESSKCVFRDTVLKWCESSLRKEGVLNFDVMKALHIEKQLGDKRDVKEILSSVSNRTKPFITRIGEGQIHKYWGVHPDCQHLDKVGDQDKVTVLVDKVFSRHKIICFVSLIGLEASGIEQFSDGKGPASKSGNPGRYFTSYQKRIRELLAHEALTPHLDKRWHLPYYMADINEAQATIDKKRLENAFIIGLVNRYYFLVKHDAGLVWSHRGLSRNALIRSEGNTVPGNIISLWDALARNPGVVESVLQDFTIQQEIDFEKYKNPNTEHHHLFIKNCSHPHISSKDFGGNILDIILRLPRKRPKTKVVDNIAEIENLLKSLNRVIMDYFIDAHGPDSKKVVEKKTTKMIEKLYDGSDFAKAMDPSDRMKGILDDMKNGVVTRELMSQ